MTPSDNEWDKYKVSAPKQAAGDDWDKYIVKKKVSTPASEPTSPQLPSGLGTIPSFQTLTEPSTAPYTQEYLDSQKKQQEYDRQAQVDKANKLLEQTYSKLDPQTKEAWQKINSVTRNSDELRQPSDEEIAHWKFMDTPM